MKWLGLTGGMGSGKSSVAEILVSQGVQVISADELARWVVGPGSGALEEIARLFPETITGTGELDRKKLGEVVFNDPEKLRSLEAVLHPLIQKEALRRRQELEKKHLEFAVYDVPLLFEKNMESQFDLILLVDCDPEQQLERIAQRDGLLKAQIEKRLAQQVALDEKRKKADVVFDNRGGLEALKTQVLKWLKSYQLQ